MNKFVRYFFISDDSFFLLGIKHNLEWNFGRPCYVINTNDESGVDFHPQPGDIVILAVDNADVRRIIMRMLIAYRCRILMMLSVPLKGTCRSTWPWLISKNIRIRDLVGVLLRATSLRRYQDTAPLLIKDIFYQMSRGLHINELSERLQVSVKYIYQVRRSQVLRYGLTGCNSVGVLICRDILEYIPDR